VPRYRSSIDTGGSRGYNNREPASGIFAKRAGESHVCASGNSSFLAADSGNPTAVTRQLEKAESIGLATWRAAVFIVGSDRARVFPSAAAIVAIAAIALDNP